MEKRVLIAFLLSFVVLSTWTALFPPAKPQGDLASRAAPSGPKQAVVPSEAISPSDIQPKSISEKTVVIENNKLKVEISSDGGSIKNVTIKEFDVTLPVTHIFGTSFGSQDCALSKISNSRATCAYTGQGDGIVKEFELTENSHVIDVIVQSGDKMSNLHKMSNLEISGYDLDVSRLDKKIVQSAERSLQEYSIALVNRLTRKTNAVEFSAKENKTEQAEVSWVGFRDQYFCMVLKPKFKTSEYSIVAESKNNLLITLRPSEDLADNKIGAKIYVGPQNMNLLASYQQGFEHIMVFSGFGFLDIFAKILYYILQFLHGVFKNWGAAIILLGILIYVVTYPLTAKSMSSMRKMQALQPKLKALQDKYKKDPQKLNKEMMELYKENSVNPFGGCLPMFLQAPIFFALYQVLWRSVDFKGAEFLWINDLSKPDKLFQLPFNIPWIGTDFNILPLLMVFVMFFQQKFTMKSMPATDPNQVMQQKVMLFLMPVMMGFIFYHFASGLCLYFTVFYILSTLTQWKMSKQNVVING